jgi:hypothetical protein
MNRYPGNHMDSGIVTLPRQLKTRPGAPQTHLAYITGDEAQMLQGHKPGTPHKGPHGIPNYDAFDIDSGAYVGGGDWQESSSGVGSVSQPQDTSYSTRDVRSSVDDRQDFREQTGSTVVTPAETIAKLKAYRTGNEDYLSEPIWSPSISYEDQQKIAELGHQLWEQEQATGKRVDWSKWFDSLRGLTDISDTGYEGTSKGWYLDEEETFASNFDPGNRSNLSQGYGHSYGNRPGGYGTGLGGIMARRWNTLMKNRGNLDSPMPPYYASLKNPGQPYNIPLFNKLMYNMYS